MVLPTIFIIYLYNRYHFRTGKDDIDGEDIKKKTKPKKVANSDDSDTEVVVSKVKKSFALLQISDDDQSEPERQPHEDSESESKPVKKDSKKKSNSDDNRTKDKGGKKGKKIERTVMIVMKILKKFLLS